LIQSLKQRLEEEALRRTDEDQMLLNVVDEMEQYLPYKDKSEAELKQLAQEAKTKVETAGSVEERERWRDRFRMFDLLTHDYNRDMLNLFADLTPEQLVALRNGQKLEFTHNGDGSENSLPPDMAERIKNHALNMTINKPMSEYNLDEVNLHAQFTLGRQRPDQVTLSAGWVVEVKAKGAGSGSSGINLINGRPDHLRTPGNALAHASLNKVSAWNTPVTLDTQSDTPEGVMKHAGVEVLLAADRRDDPTGEHPAESRDWVDSADFFAELHKKTGRNVIADYYTRVYPRSAFTAKEEKLLGLLNEAADALSSDWQSDGDFLRFRRFNYYSEREMDVPNRLLRKWADDRRRVGYMTLDDLAEASSAVSPDAQMHQDLKRAILIKYGLDEWTLLPNNWGVLKVYSLLNPEQRRQVQTNEGLLLGQLDPSVARECIQSLQMDEGKTPEEVAQGRVYMRVRPPGRYEWRRVRYDASPFPIKIDVSETTREKAVEAVRQIAPDTIGNIRDTNIGPQGMRGPGAALEAQIQVGREFRMMAIEGGLGSWSSGGTVRE
jgi:hypothetical protein